MEWMEILMNFSCVFLKRTQTVGIFLSHHEFYFGTLGQRSTLVSERYFEGYNLKRKKQAMICFESNIYSGITYFNEV